MDNVTKKTILEKENKLYDEYKRYFEMFGEEHFLTQHARAKWSVLFELVYMELKLK